jgi:light-regulated signal transduction histidine kinase (bacteriophytochrome)
VSHDLRAPLAAIGGFSRALEGKLAGLADEKASHYLSRIHAGVVKMEQLIEALLQLSRVGRAPIEWGEVDVSALAHETLEGLQMQDPSRQVDVRIEEGLVAHGDARLLRIVLQNLLGNAWKFTARTDAPAIHVGRTDAAFFVRDNGVGFDMAYAGKLFNAFQRLHSEAEFPGTGIGLATVRRIVGRHQGRVWVESEPGLGTTFYFSLPETVAPARVP